jgi:hypothetical protein
MLSKAICNRCLNACLCSGPVFPPPEGGLADRIFWSCTVNIKKGSYRFVVQSEDPPAGCERMLEQAVVNSVNIDTSGGD